MEKSQRKALVHSEMFHQPNMSFLLTAIQTLIDTSALSPTKMMPEMATMQIIISFHFFVSSFIVVFITLQQRYAQKYETRAA